MSAIKPFALMLAPVYVFLKSNAKFLAIKGPLDFFSHEELLKLVPYETFYVPAFASVALPFRDAAKSVRLTLSWRPQVRVVSSTQNEEDGKETYPEVPLPPAPYELSDAVLRIVGPLWGAGGVVEPFFVTVFSHELCDALPWELMKKARDLDVGRFEEALFVSSWTVFLALHLGRCDLDYLSRLRAQVVAAIFSELPFAAAYGPMSPDSRDLFDVARATFTDTQGKMSAQAFAARPERVAQMLAFRMERVLAEFVRKDRPAPTIYGEKGLIDAAVG